MGTFIQARAWCLASHRAQGAKLGGLLPAFHVLKRKSMWMTERMKEKHNALIELEQLLDDDELLAPMHEWRAFSVS